ncbi:MAG: magnesium chelatase domain-containing protein [Acidimicrobiales bacterium]
MLASVSAATLNGAVGRPVSVEVHVSNGLPGFTIVGLPDAALRESRDRVWAALPSSGLPWPLRLITVNLAPSTFPDVTLSQCNRAGGFAGKCGEERRNRPRLAWSGVSPRMKCPRELTRGQLHPQTGAFSE